MRIFRRQRIVGSDAGGGEVAEGVISYICGRRMSDTENKFDHEMGAETRKRGRFTSLEDCAGGGACLIPTLGGEFTSIP